MFGQQEMYIHAKHFREKVCCLTVSKRQLTEGRYEACNQWNIRYC